MRELFRDDSTLTPRYVLWLIEHLDETSATVANDLGGPEHRGWSTDRALAVASANALREANWQRGGKGPRPKPITPPKPRTQHRGRRVVTVAELNARM